MSYKERSVTATGYSRLDTDADDSIGMVRDVESGRMLKSDDHSVLIPFHAVDRVVATTSTEDKEEKNPYYCEAENGGGGSSEVGRAKVCVDCVE